MEQAEVPFRILPALSDRNRFFWTGGADGHLRFLRCGECAQLVHPPLPRCPRCRSRELAPHAVSGRARVHTFTVNHQPWMPGPEPPFVVAVVEIEEDPGVRLTTNLVGVDPEAVEIGLRVRAVFERHPDEDGDVWIPLFEPDPD